MPRRIIPSVSNPNGYEQNMDAAQNWPGTSPTNEDTSGHADAGVFSPGLFAVPIDSVNNRGGLFTPGQAFQCKVTQIDLVVPAGVTSWTFSRERGADSHIFLSGTTVGDFFFEEGADELPALLPGDTIKLVSAGVPAAPSKCTIYFQSNKRG